MTRRRPARASAAALLGASAVATVALLAVAGAGAAPDARKAPVRLQAFGSCGALLTYVKQQALPLVQPWGLGGTLAAGRPGVALPSTAAEGRAAATDDTASTPEYSTTNVQEKGVDEPDLVKSNGRFLFVVSQGSLHAVDVRGRDPRLVGSLPLPEGWGSELLLAGNRLLVLSRGGWIEPLPAATRAILPAPGGTVLREVDVSNPTAMKVVRTLTLDGSAYVTARLVGSTARVVLGSAMPARMPFVTPAAGTPEAVDAARARNRTVVSRSGVKAWLPRVTLKRRGAKAASTRSLVQCRNVYRPTSFSGLGLLTVLTLDLTKGIDPVHSEAIVTDGRIVYASPESLYVATERWADRPAPDETPADAPDGVTTAIHRFDISDPARTRYAASGSVPGFLLSQWSLSEHDGFLRVASTEAPAWWVGPEARESESSVSVLAERGGKLELVGRVGGLGRGERIYAVRFMGDTGYVVTFRQVDPLYTLDLSNPRRPAVLGELKIQGYSAYLHPVGEDLLLGLGQDATAEGRVTGTQLSLFDVSNLRAPKRLAQATVGPGGSEAEYDHHAFLHWPRTGLVAVPVHTYEPDRGKPPFAGVIGFRVSRAAGIGELGRVVHDAGGAGSAYPIRRSLVVGDALYTVSDLGVRASSLATFADRGWAGFPQPKAVDRSVPGGTVPSPR